MAIYRIVTPAVSNESGGDVLHVRYAASNGAAKHTRQELMEAYGFKRADIDIVEADVHKGKAGLIEFLNAYHAQLPASYHPTGYTKIAAAATRAKPAAKRPAKRKPATKAK